MNVDKVQSLLDELNVTLEPHEKQVSTANAAMDGFNKTKLIVVPKMKCKDDFLQNICKHCQLKTHILKTVDYEVGVKETFTWAYDKIEDFARNKSITDALWNLNRNIDGKRAARHPPHFNLYLTDLTPYSMKEHLENIHKITNEKTWTYEIDKDWQKKNHSAYNEEREKLINLLHTNDFRRWKHAITPEEVDGIGPTDDRATVCNHFRLALARKGYITDPGSIITEKDFTKYKTDVDRLIHCVNTNIAYSNVKLYTLTKSEVSDVMFINSIVNTTPITLSAYGPLTPDPPALFLRPATSFLEKLVLYTKKETDDALKQSLVGDAMTLQDLYDESQVEPGTYDDDMKRIAKRIKKMATEFLAVEGGIGTGTGSSEAEIMKNHERSRPMIVKIVAMLVPMLMGGPAGSAPLPSVSVPPMPGGSAREMLLSQRI